MNELGLIKLLRTENRRGLALDIDETICDTNTHWFTLLQDIFGNPEKLTPREMVKRYRYTQKVPYWKTPDAQKWMDDKIHSDDFHRTLPVIPDAREYVQKVIEVIPVVAYITARPQEVVSGTEYWLRTNGFPDAPIVARPEETIGHFTTWKAGVLSNLYPYVLGIVDDHPGMVEELLPDYPGTIFLITHSEHPRRDLRLFCGRDWPEMVEQIKKHNPLQ